MESPGTTQRVPCQKSSVIFLRNITLNWATTTSSHALSYSLFIIITVTHESLCTSAGAGEVPHIEHCDLCLESVRVPSKAYRDCKYGTVTVTCR